MNRAAAERESQTGFKGYLMRLRCERSICVENSVFGFVPAGGSRWEIELFVGAGGHVGGATLQSVLWLRELRMRRERPRGSGDK